VSYLYIRRRQWLMTTAAVSSSFASLLFNYRPLASLGLFSGKPLYWRFAGVASSLAARFDWRSGVLAAPLRLSCLLLLLLS
jgi:hypothetical protein